jgi:8-oxo-dGTP diphosphatase
MGGSVTFVRVDVACVLLFDATGERVLMVQDNGSWGFPGGGREPGELLNQTAVREAKEETGLDVTVGGIIHVSERFIGNHQVLFVTFRGEIVSGQIGTSDPEIGALEWKSVAEAERLMPFYRDIRGLAARTAHYQGEP